MITAEQSQRVPEIFDKYKTALEEMIDYQKDGVTIYRGGPMDLCSNGVEESWLSPVTVTDEEGSTSFHIIQTGGGREEMQSTIFELNVASDIALKLDDRNSSQVAELKDVLYGKGNLKRTIIRPSVAGNIAYPSISTPLDLSEPETIFRRAKKIAELYGSELKHDTCDLESLRAEKFTSERSNHDFNFGKERKVSSPIGEVFLYPVLVNSGDPWGYYEIISAKPISEIDKNSIPIIRVDSGCDTGQCYHDSGCDCRSQLHNALKKIQDNDSFVIHIPSQDGRGYGMAPKMATEGGKRGINVGYNAGLPAMDTITAAKELLGNNYDIRTYEGVGRLLIELGFTEIILITDSQKKIASLEKVGIVVHREPTNTLDDTSHRAHRHVAAKHQTDEYF